MADIQPVLDLLDSARQALAGVPQAQAASAQLAQAREQLAVYAQQRDAEAAQLQVTNATLQQQLVAAQAEVARLHEQVDEAPPTTTPVDLARSFRDVVDTVQSEARTAPGIGVTIRSMDIEVKGLVTVDQQGTSLVLPQPGTGIDAGALSTLRVSFGAIPVPAPRAPTVTGVDPAGGPPAGGTRVTVSGGGFTGATGVQFGSAAGTELQVQSDAQLLVTSPPGAGTVDVTVTTPVGTSPALPGNQFTYAEPPVIVEVKPNAGPIKGGTEVNLIGSGFADATGVSFGPAAALEFKVGSDKRMVAVSPPGQGKVMVSVTGPGGASAPSDAATFTYQPG